MFLPIILIVRYEFTLLIRYGYETSVIYLFVAVCVACEENESVDPTIMPEATTTGANTFGCLVDGWVYTSGRWGMPSAEYLEREEGSSVTVSAQVVSVRISVLRLPIPRREKRFLM